MNSIEKRRPGFIDMALLAVAIEDWRTTGEPGTGLCLMLRKIAAQIINRPTFQRVWKSRPDLKDDASSAALIKQLRALKNITRDRQQTALAYLRLAAYHATLGVISKSMRTERRDEIVRQALMRQFVSELPWLAASIGRKPDVSWTYDEEGGYDEP